MRGKKKGKGKGDGKPNMQPLVHCPANFEIMFLYPISKYLILYAFFREYNNSIKL